MELNAHTKIICQNLNKQNDVNKYKFANKLQKHYS